MVEINTLKSLGAKPEGSMNLIYGPTGVGKTVSTLQSVMDPVMYIRSEQRETRKAMRAVRRPDIKMKVVDHDNFDDLIGFCSGDGNFKNVRSIVLDSASHLMNVRLSQEIQGEAYKARDSKKIDKKLASQSKLTLEGYGVAANCMVRLCNIFMSLASKNGIHIIMLSLEESHPTWNRELVGAPAFMGKSFGDNFPGFFDLIGRVSSKKDNDKNIQYPPKVTFQSPDGNFVAKATGGMTKFTWPLNWAKILTEG